jgi:TonB family protein
VPAAAPIARPAPVETQPKRPVAATPAAPAAPVKPGLASRPPSGDAVAARKKPSFFASPVGWGVIAGVLVLLGGGYFFYQNNAEEKAAALRAQVQAEQRATAAAKAEAEARRLAKQADDARRAAEAEVARRNAAAEVASRQAQEESRRRQQETNSLLNGRGSLVIATEPAGAAIAIANLAPRVSPATISDLRLGHYTVNLTLAGFDPVSLDLEVKENATTDPGVIRLVRQVGGLELVTEPAGLRYEIRPAASRFFATGTGTRQGTTPATITDLTTGDYVVVLLREGWPNHEENFTIARGDTARVSWKASGGTVEIVSTPAGATVGRNGVSLGVTPLTLTDIPPGDVSYTIELSDYTAASLRGTVEPERKLRLETELEASAEHIARINELDTRPEVIKRVQPSLTYRMEVAGGNVTISCVVDRDGVPKNLRIDKQTDTELGKRCLEAAAQWRFKPGMIKGKPVKTRVTLPFIITPSSN